jgi:hypothetical protein
MLVAEVNVMEAERYLSGEQETRLEAEASAGADRHRTGPGPERGGGGVTGLCDRLAVIEAPDAAVGRLGSGGGARGTFPLDVSAVVPACMAVRPETGTAAACSEVRLAGLGASWPGRALAYSACP